MVVYTMDSVKGKTFTHKQKALDKHFQAFMKLKIPNKVDKVNRAIWAIVSSFFPAAPQQQGSEALQQSAPGSPRIPNMFMSSIQRQQAAASALQRSPVAAPQSPGFVAPAQLQQASPAKADNPGQ